MAKPNVRRWYHWYSPDDSPEERALVLKLDLLIIPYTFIIYWVKYINQTNISTNMNLRATPIVGPITMNKEHQSTCTKSSCALVEWGHREHLWLNEITY